MEDPPLKRHAGGPGGDGGSGETPAYAHRSHPDQQGPIPEPGAGERAAGSAVCGGGSWGGVFLSTGYKSPLFSP